VLPLAWSIWSLWRWRSPAAVDDEPAA